MMIDADRARDRRSDAVKASATARPDIAVATSSDGLSLHFWAVPAIAGVASVCIYTTRRTNRLVRDVASEQRRRERLGRYFSPQVAAHVEQLGDGAAAGESREVTLRPVGGTRLAGTSTVGAATYQPQAAED